MNPHSARRGFSVQTTENGAPHRLVQLGGGWKSLAVLETYLLNLQLTPEMLDPYLPVSNAVGSVTGDTTTDKIIARLAEMDTDERAALLALIEE